MNHELSVSESIAIHAPVERVWETMTNPALIKEYLFGTETITDWKPGSEIVFQGAWEEQTYRDSGTIQENILHRKISYSYWSGFSGLPNTPENHSLVIYEMEPKGAETIFTWTQIGFPDESRQAHSKDGMTEFLKQIKAIAERN